METTINVNSNQMELGGHIIRFTTTVLERDLEKLKDLHVRSTLSFVNLNLLSLFI
jgi:hypothetical protein